MALILCEDCGKEISSKAPACIHCGCPLIQQASAPTRETFLYEVINNTKDKFYREYVLLSREENDIDSRAAKYAISFASDLLIEYHKYLKLLGE